MPEKPGVSRWIRLFFCGLLMGAAEVVPGVSGGTIAFITGIYEELIGALKSLNGHTLAYFLQLKYKKFFAEVRWKFLACIISANLVALLLFSRFIDYTLNNPEWRTMLYAAFFGLIIASIVICARQLSSWKGKEIFALVIGAILAFALTESRAKALEQKQHLFDVPVDHIAYVDSPIDNLNQETRTLTGITSDQLSAMLSKHIISHSTVVYDHALDQHKPASDVEFYRPQSSIDIWIIICGIVAISGMLLPGVSGSYLLHILGVYGLIIGALADLTEGLRHFTMEKEALWVLTNLLFGILIGAILFSRVVSVCMKNYRQMTLATLIGFMIGALRSIWPFWSYSYVLNPLRLEKGPLIVPLDPKLPAYDDHTLWIAGGIAISSFLLLTLIDYLKRKKLIDSLQTKANP